MLCSTILLKEGNVLFHDALNTLYLRLHGVRYMAKDHSDSERRNHIGDSFRLAASVILYSSSHKQDITPAVWSICWDEKNSMGPP